MVMNTRPEDSDEDDSLFGSPPPSPQSTGRPTLALPNTMSTGSSGSRPSTSTAPATQNVGTIALPGSHPDSEFPINPLALSLNHGIVQRPPAPAQLPPPAAAPAHAHTYGGMPRGGHNTWPRTSGAGHVSASTSQQAQKQPQSLITPLSKPPKPTKKKPKKATSSRSSKESTPAPPPPAARGPEFTLPDPSAPPPSHFLRNQENLLGKAGRVAGVKPSALTHSHTSSTSTSSVTRGSTPSNPILIDEGGDDETPLLGRRRRSHSRDPIQPYIDPALLTAPTNQEIVSVLIGQKDIFPILEGVLKLVVGNVPGGNGPPPPMAPPPTGFERRPLPVQQQQYQALALEPSPPPPSTATAPPLKKRKLNRVPAGASDWDVPYPFPQGEGPDAYRKTWERERGKQLISQLIKLIKSAARKAATKKYMQKEREKEEEAAWRRQRGELSRTEVERGMERREGHYREGSGGYGGGAQMDAGGGEWDVLQDASNTMHVPMLTSVPGMMHVQPSALSAPTIGARVGNAMHMPSLEELLGTCNSSAAPNANGMPDIDFSIFNTYPAGDASASLDALSSTLNTSGLFPSGALDTSSAETSPALDQAAFDSWMNFLVDTFPTSFDSGAGAGASTMNANANANQTFDMSSNPARTTSSSHCSTPGPDEFSFAGMFGTGQSGGVDGNTAGGTGTGDYDLAAMLSSILNQPLAAAPASVTTAANQTQTRTQTQAQAQTTQDKAQTPATDAGAGADSSSSHTATAPSPIGDQMIDPALLALSRSATLNSTSNANANKDISASANLNLNLNTSLNFDLGLNMNMNMNANSNSSFTDNAVTSTSTLLTVPSSSSALTSTSTSTSTLPPSSSSSSSLTSLQQAASPIASASTSSVVSVASNDPATPASAGWDMSLPDVYMDMGGVEGGGGSFGGGGLGGGMGGQGQGMWRSTMWSNFGEMAHGPLIDWESLGGGVNMSMDVDTQDFGVLPEVDAGLYATTMKAVDKGKGRAVDLGSILTPTPASTSTSTSTSTRTNTPAPPLSATTAQSAFRALLGASSACTSAPAPSLADATFAPSTTAALESARIARRARKDDIIRRAQEKRRRVQAELDGVKMKLWETTIEQAGLVHLVRRLREDEAVAGVVVDAGGAGDAGEHDRDDHGVTDDVPTATAAVAVAVAATGSGA